MEFFEQCRAIVKKSSRSQLIVVIGLLIILLTAILQAYLIAFIILVLLFAVLLPLGTKGIITRIVFVVALICSANTIVALVTWLLRVPFTPALMVYLYTTLALLMVIVGKAKLTIEASWKVVLPHGETIILAASIIVAGMLLLPFTLRNDTPTLMRGVASGVDNIAHLHYIRAVEARHGYLQGYHSALDEQLGKGANAYPQGFHLNASLANQLAAPTQGSRPVRQSLLLFIAVSVITYSALFYMLAYVGLQLTRRITGKQGVVAGFIASLVGATLLLNTLLPLYFDGFQPQIASIVLLLILAVVLNDFVESRAPVHKKTYAAEALLLVTAIGFVYLYLWPVALGGTALIVGHAMFRRSFVVRPWFFSILVLLTLLSFSQLVLHLLYAETSVSKLNDQGGALALNHFMLFGLVALVSMYIGSTRKRIEKSGTILVFLGMAIAFALAIFVFQKATLGGTPKYYYFKALHTIMVLTAVMAIPLLVEVVYKAKYRWRITIVCLSLLCLVWGVHSMLLTSLVQRHPFSFLEPLAARTALLVSNKYYTDRSTQIISIGNNCMNADDLRVMRLVMTFSGKATVEQEKIAELSLWPDEREAAYKKIQAYQLTQREKRLFVIAADPEVRNAITSHAGIFADKLHFIDPYAGITKPITGCPNIDKPTAR